MDAQNLAGEIVRLLEMGSSRNATQEKRLSDLCATFGDHEGSGTALVRAAMKGDADAIEALKSF